jgi:hypothetical protein
MRIFTPKDVQPHATLTKLTTKQEREIEATFGSLQRGTSVA